jgi:hypothetical protein
LYVAAGNSYFGGTVTYAGGINFNGNVTVGDSSADTLTINSTITSNLIFTDNTYDIANKYGESAKDINGKNIPYKGEPAGVTDLVANRVQVMIATVTTVLLSVVTVLP